jgi:uncharacterized coiled-coil protein SlyX
MRVRVACQESLLDDLAKLVTEHLEKAEERS